MVVSSARVPQRIVDKAKQKVNEAPKKLKRGGFSIRVNYDYRLISHDRVEWLLVTHSEFDKLFGAKRFFD